MKKNELEKAFGALTPSAAQKRQMLESVLQAAPVKQRRGKPVFLVAAPICASLLLCVALVAFTLTRGGNQPTLPSDTLAEIGNTTSEAASSASKAPSTAPSGESSRADASEQSSQAGASVSSKLPQILSKPPSDGDTTTPVSSAPSAPADDPTVRYDFDGVAVDYLNVSVTWDEKYAPEPPVSSEPTVSGDQAIEWGDPSEPPQAPPASEKPGNILGTPGTPPDAYEPPTEDPMEPADQSDSSVLWLGDRRYCVPTDDDLCELLEHLDEDSIGAQISATPSGKAICRIGDTDDILAVENPLGGWTIFCFDGLSAGAWGRDTLAVYGAISPDSIDSIYVRYEADGKICSYDFVAREPIAALYDSLYFATSFGVSPTESDDLIDIVLNLTNGRVIPMQYDREKGVLIRGVSILNARGDTALGAAIETLLSVE